MILFALSIVLSFIYLWISISSVFEWHTAPEKRPEGSSIHTEQNVSIIIIARNEESNISGCLKSIRANTYPEELYEIILVDDHYEDGTIDEAEKLSIPNLRILQLKDYDLSSFENSYKKAGQYYGIAAAKHDLILSTDADCRVGKHWIDSMINAISDADLVTGPISLSGPDNFLAQWQIFENIGIMMFTCLGIKKKWWYSANAANMIYRKNLYEQFIQNGPSKNASGDDIFLINWAAREGYKTGFEKRKEAIVVSDVQKSFHDFCQQRIRWATKSRNYKVSGIQIFQLYIFIFALTILMLVILGVFVYEKLLWLLTIVISFKWIADTIVLRSGGRYFGLNYPFLQSPIFSLFHWVYIIAVGLAGIFKSKYSWKGRTVD